MTSSTMTSAKQPPRVTTSSSKLGYFIGLKGKRNVLIVRESGSKMPADLGGDIYASLPDKSNIAPIERTVSAFIGSI